MQLKELSERTGVTPASIKYYLREGLLPPGESIHATRARYSELHIRRLGLIQALRQIVQLNIEQIRNILALADSGAPRLQLLAAIQREVLGLYAGDDPGGPGSELGDVVVFSRNWPDVHSDARTALNAQLAKMQSLSVPVSKQLLDAYSSAMDAIAGLDIRLTTDNVETDQMILTAAVGMHTHSQLLLKLLALAQASHAIMTLENSNAGPLTAEVPSQHSQARVGALGMSLPEGRDGL